MGVIRIGEEAPDFAGGVFTSQHAAEIILALKSIRPKQGGISRPVINLIQATLEEFGIHLQVEDIAGGVLLFWQTQVDFDKSDRLLNEVSAKLREHPVWDQGFVEWELHLLKPSRQKEGQKLLEECRKLVVNMFGPQGAVELIYPTLSFHAPKILKFLDDLWEYYRAHNEVRGKKTPRLSQHE